MLWVSKKLSFFWSPSLVWLRRFCLGMKSVVWEWSWGIKPLVGSRLSCLPLFFFLACGKRQSRICPWGYYTSDHFFRCLPLSWFCGRWSRSVWTRKGGVCRLPVTCWLTTLVFYTGLTRSLLLESVCRSGLSFSVIGKEDKNAGIFFGKKFTGSR